MKKVDFQVNYKYYYFRLYFQKAIVIAHFQSLSKEVIVMHSEKAKLMK